MCVIFNDSSINLRRSQGPTSHFLPDSSITLHFCIARLRQNPAEASSERADDQRSDMTVRLADVRDVMLKHVHDERDMMQVRVHLERRLRKRGELRKRGTLQLMGDELEEHMLTVIGELKRTETVDRWVDAQREHEEAQEECAAEQRRIEKYEKKIQAAKAALATKQQQARAHAKKARIARARAEDDYGYSSSTTTSDSDDGTATGYLVMSGPHVLVTQGHPEGNQGSAGMRRAEWTKSI